MARVIYPSADELIETNQRVLEQIQAKRADRHAVLSRKKLEDAIDKAKSEEGDLYDKASVLLIELVTGHAFASGVRRTAYAVTISFLRVNGERPSVSHDPKVLTGIRERFYTKAEVKAWLKGNAIRSFTRE
ncbi:MAG TPA: Fic family protein [Spirochaetia bacterium]|nr:Fic family protein [Spirochaetia bacterium]